MIADCVEDEPYDLNGVQQPIDTSQPNPNGRECVRLTAGLSKLHQLLTAAVVIHDVCLRSLFDTVGVDYICVSQVRQLVSRHERHHPSVFPPRRPGALSREAG